MAMLKIAMTSLNKVAQKNTMIIWFHQQPPRLFWVQLRQTKNRQRVVRNGEIGARSRYTSANYNLIQALIDVHGGGFVAHTNQLFNDLNMTSSTFASPYLGRNGINFARGHERGVMQETVAYGGLAAASLVSTAADIGRFVIAINMNGGTVLSSDGVDKLLGRDADVMAYCTNNGDMRLGINRNPVDSDWGLG